MRYRWDATIPAVVLATAMIVGTVTATGGLGRGDWRASSDRSEDRIRFDLRLPDGTCRLRTSLDANRAALEGFDAEAFGRRGAPLRLTHASDAGRIVFEGEGGRRPRGKFRFEPNTQFVANWKSAGFGALTEEQLILMAIEGVRLADCERIHELGYGDINAGEMIRLKQWSIPMEWIEAMQALETGSSLEELFRLRAHGVDADDVTAFAAAGLQELPVDEFLRLRSHGIRASYVRGLQDSGIDATDIDAVVRLYSHGIDPAYVAGVRSSGLPDVDVDAIVTLHTHGVGSDYVHEVVAAGLPGVAVEDVVRLHTHGVRSAPLKLLVAAGPGKGGADDIIQLSNHGISVDWVRPMADLGYGDLSTEEWIRLHSNGVTPNLVRSVVAAGHPEPSVDDLVIAATQGAEALDRPH